MIRLRYAVFPIGCVPIVAVYLPITVRAMVVGPVGEIGGLLPDGAGFEAGACLGIPVRTVHRCVFAYGAVAGESVLVVGGAGVVGGFAVSFAKWGGAEVIATVGSEGQAEAALGASADHALNYRADDVAACVAEITGGSGVGRVVEVAFGSNLALDTEVIALHGTMAAYASDAEPEPRLPSWPLLFKNITVRLVGSDDLPEDAERRAAEDIASCLEAGVLRPPGCCARAWASASRWSGSPRPARRWRAAAPGAAWSLMLARGGPHKGPRSSWWAKSACCGLLVSRPRGRATRARRRRRSRRLRACGRRRKPSAC